MATLLEKAKAAKPKKATSANISPEVIELALAWATGDISFTQVSIALNPNIDPGKGSGAYITLARALRQYVQSQK